MPSGNGGQIAFAKIGSFYSDVNTANIYASFVTETLEHKLDELEEGSITGRRDAPNSYKGVDHGEGDVNFEPHPSFLGHLFKGWFGGYVSSLVTAATSAGANATVYSGNSQNYHRFTPSNSAYDGRTFLEPYNVFVYRDVGSAWLFKQAVFHQVKLDIQAGQLSKATASIMSRKVDRMARGNVASLTSGNGRPWVWDMASLELSSDTTSANLAANDQFEQLTVTFDMPQTGVSLLDGTKLYAEFVPQDFRRVTFDGTMSFRDQDAYDAFVAYEARRMRVTILNVNSNLIIGNPDSADQSAFTGYFGLRLHVPQLKFLSWSAPINGPGRIQAKFTAKAQYDEGEGFSIMAELNNTVSSAQYTTTY